jgi:hypothetical protein
VAHELVGPAQALRVHHLLVVEHDRVVERAATREACVPERVDLAQEAERARRRDVALESLRRERAEVDLLAADRRVLEVDRIAHAEVARRLDADRAIAVDHLDLAADPQQLALFALLEDPGRADQVHERRRAAVHHGQLGAVDLDPDVVDTEAEQRGEQVLDRTDRGVAAAERRGERGRCDLARARRDLDRLAEVGPHEHDPRVRARGMQRQLDGLPAMQPHPRTRDFLRNRALEQSSSPSDVRVLRGWARTSGRRYSKRRAVGVLCAAGQNLAGESTS